MNTYYIKIWHGAQTSFCLPFNFSITSHSFNLITAILIRESIYNPTRWQKASPSDLLGIPSGYLLENRRLKTCVFPQCCILKMFHPLVLPPCKLCKTIEINKEQFMLSLGLLLWFLRAGLKLEEQLKCKQFVRTVKLRKFTSEFSAKDISG